MRVKIDDKYSIGNNANNLMLQVEAGKDKEGKMKYKTIGYYVNIEHVLEGYLNEQLFNSKAQSFDELLNEIKEIRETIENLTGEKEVTKAISNLQNQIK